MAIVNRAEKRAAKAAATKESAIAFLNWGALNKHGEVAIKSSKGFAIFDNQYSTKQEAQLVQLAEKNGGEITLNMVVTIRLNAQTEIPELDTSDFI